MSLPREHWICTWSTGNTFLKEADDLFFQELLLVVMVHFCQMWEWFWLFLGHWTALQQVKSAITCYSFFACFWKTIINGKCLQKISKKNNSLKSSLFALQNLLTSVVFDRFCINELG